MQHLLCLQQQQLQQSQRKRRRHDQHQEIRSNSCQLFLMTVYLLVQPKETSAFLFSSQTLSPLKTLSPLLSPQKKRRITKLVSSKRSGFEEQEEQPLATKTATSQVFSLEDVTKLLQENEILKKYIKELEIENDEMREQQQHQQPKILIETFEGESQIRKAEEEKADKNQRTQRMQETQQSDMEYNDELWCDDTLDDGSCPIEPNISFLDALRDRAYWLVGLLTLQSCSGFILSSNESLLQTHPVIVYFLTMLVGAGGNAGNQASVRVIRGIALGTLNKKTQNQFLIREFKMSVALSVVLSIAGAIRALVFKTPVLETIAITSSLSLIVFTAICMGAILPLVLQKCNIDPAHSSTSIQVIMDILGVLLTVFVSTSILDSPFGMNLMSKLHL